MNTLFKTTSLVKISSLLLILISFIHTNYAVTPSGGKISKLQSQYDAIYYDINLEIFSADKKIAGYVNVVALSLADGLNKIELDLIDSLTVSKIIVNNKQLKFTQKEEKLFADLTQPLKKGEFVELSIYYSGHPTEAVRPPWDGGFNWSKDSNGDDWIGVSCQGEGGKVWIPCKTHPSDEPDSVSINITVPKPYVCASNGILDNITESKDGYRTFHWITRYPTNNYNISISIAKYNVIEKSYRSVNNNTVPVVYYYIEGSDVQADSLVDMAIDMLQTFESYFGEYPFAKEKFGLAETHYYGMEHQTINSYGNSYRYIKRGNIKFDQLMLHEMTHEWWGNKVTANDWADFWIHEGIGTYSETLYVLAKAGEEAYHEHIRSIVKNVKNEQPILKHKNATSAEAYIGDIYTKGCYFIHSLRYALGDSIFFKTLYQFANDSAYTYQNRVVTQDFLDLINKNSGKDFTPYFKMCLRTTALLDVKVDTLSDKRYYVSLSNLDFELPMELEIDGKKTRIPLSEDPIEIEARSLIVDPRRWYMHKGDFSKK